VYVPVAYTGIPAFHWKAFAPLIQEEATMAAAVLNANRGASNVLLLTQLGGGRLR
jgi:hypothetical protein